MIKAMDRRLSDLQAEVRGKKEGRTYAQAASGAQASTPAPVPALLTPTVPRAFLQPTEEEFVEVMMQKKKKKLWAAARSIPETRGKKPATPTPKKGLIEGGANRLKV
ncbi:hypothetical protein M0804_015586 [Polistes exclamans]|nr:hypothetical protein M0804_015586 [Polistes exclamans]